MIAALHGLITYLATPFFLLAMLVQRIILIGMVGETIVKAHVRGSPPIALSVVIWMLKARMENDL